MNDLLLRLDTNNERHREFANTLLTSFFHILENDALYEYMYTNTIEHRLKVKMNYKLFIINNTFTVVKSMLFYYSHHRPGI